MSFTSADSTSRILPGPISDITRQKKRSDRYSIFVEDQFLVGISGQVLTAFQLKQGQQIDHDLYKQLQTAEERQQIRQYFLNLLGRRDHTRLELLRKARRKDYTDHAVEITLDDLEEAGWIDHDAYTRSFIRDKFRLNKWGPVKIESELRARGIDRSTAEQYTSEFFKSVDLYEILQQLVDNKAYRFERIEDGVKKRKKVFDYLLRKGYYSQQINCHLDRLIESLQP